MTHQFNACFHFCEHLHLTSEPFSISSVNYLTHLWSSCALTAARLAISEQLPEHVYSTAGFDNWSKLQEGDAPSQLLISSSDDCGNLGAHDCFGDASNAQIKLNQWCAISATVDTAAVSHSASALCDSV